MAQIIIDVPDAVAPAVLDAFAKKFNYDANKIGAETKGQFAKRMIAKWVKDVFKETEASTAAETARVASLNTNESAAIT